MKTALDFIDYQRHRSEDRQEEGTKERKESLCSLRLISEIKNTS